VLITLRTVLKGWRTLIGLAELSGSVAMAGKVWDIEVVDWAAVGP
jgi:hypothetical protein